MVIIGLGQREECVAVLGCGQEEYLDVKVSGSLCNLVDLVYIKLQLLTVVVLETFLMV